MRAWMNSALRVLAAFGASWGGAVWYWRANARMPSNAELLAGLVVLPLALLLAFWLGRRLMAPATTAAPAPDAQAASASAAPASAPLPALAILASALRTPHGSSADELLAALAAQRARANLDPELLDDAGYPVMSARADDAIDPTIADEIAAWLAASGTPDPDWSPRQARALALGTAVTAELALYAAGHPHATAPDGAPRPPVLRLLAQVTSDWSGPQCAAAAGWLAQVAAQAGWPAAQVQAIVAPGAGAPGHSLEQLARQAGGDGHAPLLAMVLAFGSMVGHDGVEALAMDGALFGADNQQGLIPGEGAAGLLVADGAQAALFTAQAPTLQTATATIDPSTPRGGRPDPAHLQGLAARLLPAAEEAAGVKAVFADTGHRSAPLMELMAFTHAAMPQVDPGLDLKAVGGACGHCGDAAFLAALALAHRHAQDAGAPALCIANEHPLTRTAALVRPGTALS